MKKRIISLMLILVMAIGLMPTLTFAANTTEFAGGSGTEADPYPELKNVEFVTDHIYHNACDTICDCGHEREITHDYQMTYDSSYNNNYNTSEIDHSNVEMKNMSTISNFDDNTWAHIEGTGLEISSVSTYGTHSLKTKSINNKRESIAKPVSLDLTNKVIHFKFYVEDPENLLMLQIFFGKTGITDYYGWYHSSLKGGWHTLTVTTDSLQPKNADTDVDLLKNVEEIRIMQVSKVGTTSEVIFDNISYANQAISKGKIILQFDDQFDGTWKYAKPIMDSYGFRGVIYTIKDLVGQDQFMTLDQLKACYDDGWDISTHSQVDLTKLETPEAVRYELLKNRDYLLKNGFTRSAYHFCSHAGKYNDMVLAEIQDLFITHRTTRWGYNTLPTASKYELYNIGGNEGELSYLKAVVDNTEKTNSLTIMNWHQMVETPTGHESMTPALKSTFEQFIAYLATKDIDVVTMSDVFNPIYDGTEYHWEECTICKDRKNVTPHIYDYSCDTTCRDCGYTRFTKHNYDNAFDAKCNVCGAERTAPNTPTRSFVDVASNAWYKYYVDYAVAYGLFSGTSDTTFSPSADMTRAQFVQVLANIAGVKLDNNVSTGFSDAPAGKWFTGAVKWATSNGIASGVGNGQFNPTGKIDRQQMCMMLVNYVENYKKTTLKEKVSYKTFADDAEIAGWAKTAAIKCFKAGLVSGTGNNMFSPKVVANRATGATIFTNFHKEYIA